VVTFANPRHFRLLQFAITTTTTTASTTTTAATTTTATVKTIKMF
jgi:hypothetical protein